MWKFKLFDSRIGRPLELEDGHPPGLWTATLYILSYGIVGMLVWGALAEVREVATTKGELVPAGSIRAVQHLEGGIVAKIAVDAGDEVKAGDVILQLKPKLVSSDLNQLKARSDWLTLEDIRLAAELSDRKPDFSAYAQSRPAMVERQEATYTANLMERRKVKQAISARIASLRVEVRALEVEIERLQDEAATQDEIFQMQSDLLKKGRTSKRSFLESKIALQKSRTGLASARVRLAEIRKDLADAEGESTKTVAQAQKEVAQQYAKIAEQRLEVVHQLEKYTDRFQRLVVTAPVDGFIKNIVPKGPGAVLQPGQLIAEIVPEDQPLIAEVKIHPRDIGHVKVGDPAELAVTTYDFNVHGKLKGHVSNISASSFQDERGAPYFRGEIALEDRSAAPPAEKMRLMSGMVVEANIVTGAKSILRYLLKPIYRSIDRAFSER